MCGKILPTLQGADFSYFILMILKFGGDNSPCISYASGNEVLTVLEFWTIFSRMQDREWVFHWRKGQFYFKFWEIEITSHSRVKVKHAYCPL